MGEVMRRAWLCVVFMSSVLPTASAQDARAELTREHEAARAAHAKKDYEAFRAHSARVAELAPRSVGALYNVACAEALLGRADAAAALLLKLAAMGTAPAA